MESVPLQDIFFTCIIFFRIDIHRNRIKKKTKIGNEIRGRLFFFFIIDYVPMYRIPT